MATLASIQSSAAALPGSPTFVPASGQTAGPTVAYVLVPSTSAYKVHIGAGGHTVDEWSALFAAGNVTAASVTQPSAAQSVQATDSVWG